MKKPIIVLSCDIDADERLCMRQEYFKAIADGGGIPVVMPPFVERSRIGEWLDAVGADAVVLTGGADIDPQLYGEYPADGLGRVSLQRDVCELALFDCAMARGLSVLGICRGLQVVNVAFGGTLYQDMERQMGAEFGFHQQDAPTETPVHEVAFTGDSTAAKLFGSQFVETNSHHHQCVRIVGDGLAVSGTTVDGVVESLECEALNVLAVQFHPERMAEDRPEMASFFRNWIDAVGQKMEKRD